MKKELIILENISNHIKENKFYKIKNMILTPSVKDYLAKEKIEIVYSDKIITSAQSQEELIKKILKDEYNIVDLKNINEIIKKIKELK